MVGYGVCHQMYVGFRESFGTEEAFSSIQNWEKRV